jgi:hypothetical protein
MLSREMRKENLLLSDAIQTRHRTSPSNGGRQELMCYRDYEGVRSFQFSLIKGTNFGRPRESQFENMFRFNLIFLALLLAWSVSKAIRRAPEGYEDDSGFHFA